MVEDNLVNNIELGLVEQCGVSLMVDITEDVTSDSLLLEPALANILLQSTDS